MSTTPTKSKSGNIILNFYWNGPKTFRGGALAGGLEVGVVDLKFQNSKTEISVNIPDRILTSSPQKLKFSCRKSFKVTTPDSLIVPIEKVQNLILKAGYFEKGRPIGPKIMDSMGRITQQQTLRRSDRTVKLDVLEELEEGQTYNLVVTSKELSLSACLVKEKRVKAPIEAKRKAAKKEKTRAIKKNGRRIS